MAQTYFNVDYEITKKEIRERFWGLNDYLNQIKTSIREFEEEWKWINYDLIDYEDEELKKSEKPCYVYYILNDEKTLVKIGISFNPITRAKNMQTSTGYELEILKIIKFPSRDEALEAESFLHKEFGYYRRRPSKVAKSSEWFDAAIVPNLLKLFSSKEDIQNYQIKKNQETRNAMSKIKFLEE